MQKQREKPDSRKIVLKKYSKMPENVESIDLLVSFVFLLFLGRLGRFSRKFSGNL